MRYRPRFAALPALALAAVVAAAAAGDAALDAPTPWRRASKGERGRCEGERAPLADALFFRLRSAAFPGEADADVAVSVPRGFDAVHRPGLAVYFHGWQSCVRAAVSADGAPCAEGGDSRPGAALTEQLQAARVNAILVAVELRPDRPTGNPGRLALPGGLRALLDELFREHLAEPLGCTLDVDGLDRVAVIAHSGGYQAAASAIAFGDLTSITDVDLLDSLYGADDVFATFIEASLERYDPRVRRPRFVDLYTCCGGTAAESAALASSARTEAAQVGWPRAVYVDTEPGEPGDIRRALDHTVVFQLVPDRHGDLPSRYVRLLLASAGFATLPESAVEPGLSYPMRPK